MSKEVIVVVYRYYWQKQLSRLLSVITLVAFSVINHRYGGGSIVLDLFAMFIWFFLLYSVLKKTKFKGNIMQACRYLATLDPKSRVEVMSHKKDE